MQEHSLRLRYRVITVVVITVLAILSAVGIYQFKRANDLERAVENQYVHAFFEMTDYIKDVDVLLKKSMLAGDPRQMAALSSEIFMQSAAAKANLALLPVSELNLTTTSKFLSQVGDYTAYLSGKVIDEATITEEEFDNLQQLSDHAEAISTQLQALQTRLSAGQLSFGDTQAVMTAYAAGEPDFAGSMESLEKSFQDYPSLIYDGPFSEHIETLSPVMLENRPEFTQEEALRVAGAFLGEARSRQLAFSGEGGGSIATYNFSASEAERGEISISITRQGGYVLYMLDSRRVAEQKLGLKEAMLQAEAFLQKQGLYNMQSSYYEQDGNVATINFAAMQEDVTLYSDLIKVKVALDNGEIVGYEAKGYLMSHQPRSFPEQLMNREEAAAGISPHLSVTETGLALIPLDSMREVLCYEYKGSHNDNHFLVYINAVTGKEEQILLLLESEDGVLTV